MPVEAVYGVASARHPGGRLIPSMSSATTPAGYIASVSSQFSADHTGWKAMVLPPRTAVGWIAANQIRPVWIAIEFPFRAFIDGYVLDPWWVDNFPSRTPTAWLLQGSNDGTEWFILDSRAGQTWPSISESRTYSVADPGAYKKYRLWVTDNGGNSYVALGQFQLIGRRA